MVNTFLPPDLHVHTPYSRHAEGSMEETVLAAIEKGLTEIGFADHFPYPKGFEAPAPDCVIPDDETFERYLLEVKRLQEEYKNTIAIRLGVEIDYLPEHVQDIRRRLKQYPLDYVIGSIHIVDGMAIDYKEDLLASQMERFGGPDGLWEKYWQALEHFISLDLFQIVGHFDLPKKFRTTQVQNDFTESIGGILDRIHQRGLALEINTGGIDRASDRECYPSKAILKQAIEKNVDMAFGSDAHRPGEVGRYFPETVEWIRSVGCGRIVSFAHKGKRYTRL